MGDDAKRSRRDDDSDHGSRSQPTRDGGADCGDGTAADGSDQRTSVDGLFRLCADRDRRRALYLLDEAEGAVSLQELVARLAEPMPGEGDAPGTGSGPDASGGSPSPGEVESDPAVKSVLEPDSEPCSRSAAVDGAHQGPATDRVLTSLHHVHLPRLAEAGAVSYDREAGEVAPAFDERLSTVLEGARSLDRPGAHGRR